MHIYSTSMHHVESYLGLIYLLEDIRAVLGPEPMNFYSTGKSSNHSTTQLRHIYCVLLYTSGNVSFSIIITYP